MSIAGTLGLSASRRSLALMVLGIVLVVAYLLAEPSSAAESIRVAAPAIGFIAVIAGIARHHPPRVVPWAMVAVSLGLLVAAHLVWSMVYFGDAASTFPSVSDGLHIASIAVLAGALVLLSRGTAPDHDAFGSFEFAIVGIAVGVGIWLVVVEPYLGDDDLGLSQTIWAGVAPVLGAVAFAAAFRLLAHAGFRHVPLVALVVGIGVQTTSDALRGVLELRNEFSAGSGVAALGVVAPLVVGWAAMRLCRSTHVSDDDQAMALSVGRTVGLSVAVLTPLTVLLALTISDLGSIATRFAVALAAVVSVVLALARMWGLMDSVRTLTERRGQDRLAAMVEHSSDVVMLIDESGGIKYASPGLIGTLGHRSSDWIGRPVVDLIADEDRERARSELERVIEMGAEGTVKFESNLVRVDGQRRRMESTIANLLGGDAVDGIVATFRDVTEQRNLERQLSHRAYHDELTGLANRALFLDRMDHALRVARPETDPVVVLFVDLDDFKSVNDALGHGVGDQLLRTIADRIRHVAGSGDTPARLGGDEFALLLEDRGGVDRALDVAQRLLEELRQPVQLAGYDLAVLASVGVAVAAPGMTTSSLLRDADIAMYEAKRAGKGQIKIFDPAMRLGATSQLEFRSELGNALDNGELRLVYQPLVSLATGEVLGAEALVRWRHPVRGEVSPGEFIPIAERSGLIRPIGTWVMNEAMREAQRWQARGRRYVSINVSAIQLRAEGFVDDVRRALVTNRLAPANVLLEVTETVLVEEVESASSVLQELRDLGVRIAIDDFGTGYCSLSYLQRFPVDILKIDRQFVDEVDGDAKRSSLARMILQMSATLEITSVAEGIERPTQLAALRQLGCDIGQGYLLSRPLEVAVLHRRFGISDEPSVYAATNG
ncbi:MAG: putative bifunctional diguanylate cyclase/phosphodiesterase [Ilumatobacter sp.]|uniref:putative bifunctional diguanylate cyclase/phosphodiesterase n=1 Tax=Ilumatobacter sp. TaxID=1967498 RepID=UPI00391B20C1